MSRILRALRALALAMSASVAGLAQNATPRDLTEATLDDLMNLQVTSVSKREQKVMKTAAAIYVITQDDIRRSGATSIPDLLRQAPGMDVARIDSNAWAISVRGFNDRYSRKVLVLVDGRTVYTPSFSGVYWDQQDVPLEDIERIEIIRGPGGTVWGANAVNGVVNIITTSARATRGGLVRAGAGSGVSEGGLVQYGSGIGQKGAYRVFGSYHGVNRSPAPDGADADGWRRSHVGFRSDWDLSTRDTMTVQGDLSQAREGQTLTTVISDQLFRTATLSDHVAVNAGDILGRWNHTLANGSEMSLQVYYDRFDRREQGWNNILNTVDFDFQHHLTLGARHNLVWGLDARVSNDNFSPGFSTEFHPPRRTDRLFGTFAQDEIAVSRSLWLTLGSKFEHNSYTGFEYQPGAQLLWTPHPRQTVWLSASRAIQQPPRNSTDLDVDLTTFTLPDGNLGVVTKYGNPASLAEQFLDYEAGYRSHVSSRVSLDVTAFWGFYRRLRTSEPRAAFFEASPAPPHFVFPLVVENLAHARTYGTELFANWRATNRWRISPGYSMLHMTVVRDPSSLDSQVQQSAGSTPRHQFQVRSLLNLPHNLEWDSSLSYVGRLNLGNIPGYTRLDTRLGWRLHESVELSLVGQNLLKPRHAEFPDAYALLHTQVERSIFGKVTWRF